MDMKVVKLNANILLRLQTELPPPEDAGLLIEQNPAYAETI
jgi:hypothetical protein